MCHLGSDPKFEVLGGDRSAISKFFDNCITLYRTWSGIWNYGHDFEYR